MKEQIEEMEMTPLDVLANDINQHCPDLAENYCGDTHCVACLANAIYNAGYRKQSEGEWEQRTDVVGFVRCSVCKDCNVFDEWADGKKWNYCPECGAHMKGGAE